MKQQAKEKDKGYQGFARTWRPDTFDDVVGQEHITGTLKKAIEKDRVAHAFIFSGTRGVGKTTTARILAKALNCDKGPTPSPCGECESCRGIKNSMSMDVLEIDGASNRGIDDIRQLRDNVGFASMNNKYRIFVIDEVHMLTREAFNALLKTLEEPPPKVIFIFATTEPEKVPQTILSRCQRFDFRRIVPEQIADRLAFICKEDGIDAEKSALMLIARKAEGSMRDALSLLDQACSCCQGRLEEKEVRKVLGLVDMEVYGRLMDAVVAKRPADALALVQEILFQGFDLREFVLGLEEHLRNLLFAGIKGALESTGQGIERAVIEQLSASAERFTEGDLMRMMEIARRSETDLKYSAYPRFSVELMLLKLVHLDSSLSIEQLIGMIGKTGDAQVTPPVSRPAVQITAPDSKKKTELVLPEPEPVPEAAFEAFAESGDAVDMRTRWPEFIELLMRDRPHLGSYLALAAVVGGSTSSVDLSFQPELSFQFSEVTQKKNREEIDRMLKTFMGRHIELHITHETKKAADEVSPAVKNDNTAARDPRAIDAEIEREPVIQSVLDMFDGEIIR
ncbi:MAG: DNA polymerase III subunit gamma/tau [Chitinispirillaceae bacterium]|jgi:DNA polymerase-3 subunit gamma/tau|nr:DNA polymerase III subunit gamma/tau [Chitinispirillaceae bacterium]